MNMYEAIKTNSNRFQVLKKLDKLFEELSEIDYGDREDSPRYGNMEPGLNEQSTISEEIKNLVQDNNITKEEFTEVFEPYKYGIDISFEDYEYQPKHAEKEVNESDERLYVYSNAESEDKSDAESMIDAQYSKEAPNLQFKLRKDGNMWVVDFIGSQKDIADYLRNLGWYTDDEIVELDLIKPYN